MLEFELMVKQMYWIILLIIMFITVGRFFYYYLTRKKRKTILEESGIFFWLRLLSISTLLLLFIGISAFLLVISKTSLFAFSWMENSILASITLFIFLEIFYTWHFRNGLVFRIFNVLSIVIFGFIGVSLISLYANVISYPAPEDCTIIEVPFEGTWLVTGGGASSITNHHNKIPSQKYALDIARVGENGKLFTGKGIESNESYTYGEEVTSPVAGEVVFILDSLPDVPTKERAYLAGNHVVIKYDDSLYVALAHLQQSSIEVIKGETVVPGQLIGKVGMSGNTDFCHLHIHIQDRAIYDIENGKTYPFRFRHLKRKRFLFWKNINKAVIIRSDMVRTQ